MVEDDPHEVRLEFAAVSGIGLRAGKARIVFEVCRQGRDEGRQRLEMRNQANDFVGVTEPHDAGLGDNLSFANFTAAEIEIDHQIARPLQVAETGGRRRHLETKARGVGVLRMRKGGREGCCRGQQQPGQSGRFSTEHRKAIPARPAASAYPNTNRLAHLTIPSCEGRGSSWRKSLDRYCRFAGSPSLSARSM